MDTKMIGSKIANARKEKNMSQAQLAQLLFISGQAVGKWERGESIPDILTLNRLAEILGTDLNYFSENLAADDKKGESNQTIETLVSSESREPQLVTRFNGTELTKSDFTGVVAHKIKFNGSSLRNSDFSKADLTGSSFYACDASEINFNEANLTDCVFTATNLTDSTFHKSIMVRTELSKLELNGVRFTAIKMLNVKLAVTDLRDTIFENCVFEGVDFSNSDMRGLCLDQQIFEGVKFHNTALNDVTFNGATLKNVSFRSNALTNRYYRAIKTIRFDGAMIDKLSYAALKGIGADLSKVTLV